MSSMQFDNWAANEEILEAIDAADGVASEDYRDWLRFLNEQAEAERDAMFDDPAYIAYLEQAFGYYEDAA